MSFLQVIEKFIKENNITLSYIPIDERVIPDSIKYAILNTMKDKSTSNVSLKDLNYFIEFDPDGKTYLSVNNGYSILLIFNDYLIYDKTNMIGARTSEGNILRAATKFDYNKYVDATKNIDKRYVKPYNEVESVRDLYKEAAKRFCLYIGYLQEEYLESLRPNETFVMFDEPDSATSFTHRVPRGGHAALRKYSVLEEDERFSILESYNPVALCNCISKKSSKLTYMAYAYNLDNGLSCLIAEPVSGTSFTKICYFDEELTEDNIALKVMELLSLDYNQVQEHPHAFHAKHTSIEVFESLIPECLGKYAKPGVVHQYTRGNIARSMNGF